MLPRAHRLRSSADFTKVYRHGVSVVGPHLVVYARGGTGGESRLGLSVSKKVGGAVVRNLIRRRLTAAYAETRNGLPDGYDVIIVARPRVAGKSFQIMEEELRDLLGKATAGREQGGRQ
jgi:ribonuclease P protein component